MKLFMTVQAQGTLQGPMPANRSGANLQAQRDGGNISRDAQNAAFRNESGTRARGGVTTDRRMRPRLASRNATGTRA